MPPRDLVEQPPIVCLSHLRWAFVFQRPQHLMSRYARTRRVFFVEEPLRCDIERPHVVVEPHDGVTVVTPEVPSHFSDAQVSRAQRGLLDELIAVNDLSRYVLWYYTPAALLFSD